MCSFVTQHNATDVSSFEGACNWHAGRSTRAVARELNVNVSSISRVQCILENLAVRPTGLMPRVGERFDDDNVVNRVPQGGEGVMVGAGISNGH